MFIASLCFIALLAFQPSSPSHQFAVASVRQNRTEIAKGEGGDYESIQFTPNSLTMKNVSLRSCIRWAYGVRDDQISGPGWMGAQRYDIAAKATHEVPPAELRLMLRGLLAERFQLKLRRQNKELAVYAMVATKRSAAKLSPAPRSEDSTEATMRPVDGALEFHNFSMPALAERLATRPFSLDRLVIDQTGLEGLFNFRIQLADSMNGLKHTLEDMERSNLGATGSMLVILREQLGLSFQPKRAQVEGLFVESAAKVPGEN